MTGWRFILITIVLTKTEDFRAITSEASQNSLTGNRANLNIEKRLPDDVVPSKYVIAISTDLRKDMFYGSVRIDIEVLKARKFIALHSKDLTISSTKLYTSKKEMKVPVKSVKHVQQRDVLIVKMFHIVPTGEYFLKMNFSGHLRGKISGFYLSSYTDHHKFERKLAVTQFEPFYARNAFPCFDEPRFKSSFLIRLVHSAGSLYHALSNMPITKVEIMKSEKNKMITYFEPSPPMSTYTVAFLLSDFQCLNSSLKLLNGSEIPLAVCARPMYKDKAKFALNIAIRAMEYYLKLLKIDYPLPKLDLVAIPDFAAGAMENWGLITFRETELLHSENDSSYSNVKSVSLTVAHELAHTWFGNLVTMKWWNDLWLNEGFATYMEHLAVDSIHPEWNQMDSFPLYTKYVSMRHDSKVRARPVVKRVENSEEIEEMFDRISYQKVSVSVFTAAAVIRMLEDAIGNSRFVHGVRDYLQRYRFRNAESRELFEILRNATRAGIDLVDFANRWMKLPGFPVINIRQDNKVFQLSQQRFAISKKFHEEFDDSSWTVPIKYVTSRRDGVKFDWFLANYSCVELTLDRPVDWIKLNHGSIGYYIVNYTEDAWNNFRNLLAHDPRILSAINRADLLHDAFLLSEAAVLSYTVVMNLTSYLVQESDYQPWAVATEWFGQMNRLLDGTSTHSRFQSFASSLVDKIYRRVGWRIDAKESFSKREFGTLILNAACSVAHKYCLETAGMKLRNFLRSNGTRTLPADIRSIVYSYGLVTQSGDFGSILENMSRLLATESDAQERERLMIGLTGMQDEGTLNRYLERALDEKFIRKQDFTGVLVKIAMNPAGLDIAWNFVRSHWEFLSAKYGPNGYTLGKAILAIVSLFKDRQRLEEATRFFAEHADLRITKNAKRNAIEEIENSINWLDANTETIDRWLDANGFD